MKLVTRLKERPSRSSSLAALILDRWSSTSGRESHRGDRPWPGTQCWHVTGSPDVRAIFRIPLRPMEHSQPISIQRAACSKPHSRHRLRDNGSAIRNLRWALVTSGVRPAASRPPVITRPHRTRECASAADHRHQSGRASAHAAPTRSAGTTPTRSGSAPPPKRTIHHPGVRVDPRPCAGRW